jgi:hypothetical protein
MSTTAQLMLNKEHSLETISVETTGFEHPCLVAALLAQQRYSYRSTEISVPFYVDSMLWPNGSCTFWKLLPPG